MFANYVKRFSIKSYGNKSFSDLTCFEKVSTVGSTIYYLVDWIQTRVILFDANWSYQNYSNLPFQSYSMKYASGSFFLSADSYFYKTDFKFNPIAQYYNLNAGYRGIFFSKSTSMFYVVSYKLNRIDIFNTDCQLQQKISISGSPWSINSFNGNLYVGTDSSQVMIIQNNMVNFTINSCYTGYVLGIYFDQYGNMATTCHNINIINLYTYNGVFENTLLQTSAYPYALDIDFQGRMIVVSLYELDIYY